MVSGWGYSSVNEHFKSTCLWFNYSIRMDQQNLIEVALWVGGIFLLIISGLLGWIGVMQKETKSAVFKKNDEQDRRLEKHDEEIHELALQGREVLTIIKHKLKL